MTKIKALIAISELFSVMLSYVSGFKIKVMP